MTVATVDESTKATDNKRPRLTTDSKIESERESATSKNTRPTVQTTSGPKKNSDKIIISQKDRKYDKYKRKREFKIEWKKSFPWLLYKDNKMFCKHCSDCKHIAQQDGAFLNGTNHFRLQNIKSHDVSRQHQRCTATVLARECPDSAPMNVALANMSTDILSKMCKLFNIAYFVAWHEMPFTKFAEICRLHTKNGLNLGETYMNDKECSIFVKCIAAVERNKIRKHLHQANFFSFMPDGSTDSGVIEQEAICVRYVCNGQPVNKFLSIQDLKNGKATGVQDAVERAFHDVYELDNLGNNGDATLPNEAIDVQPIIKPDAVSESSSDLDDNDDRALDNSLNNLTEWKRKTIAAGTDGAAVMTGSKSGMVTLMRKEMPWLLGFHCIAHRLELSVLDVMKAEKHVAQVKDLLQGLYKQYHYSPKALRELNEVAEALEENVSKPTNILGTRWTPHIHRALDILLTKNFKVLYTHFEHVVQDGKSSAEMVGRAKQFVKLMKNRKELIFMHFLLDVLADYSNLSLKFQRNDITVSSAIEALEALCMSLTSMKQPMEMGIDDRLFAEGEHLSKFIDECSDSEGSIVWNDITLTTADNDIALFEISKNRIIDELIKFTMQRLGDIEKGGILEACSILDPANWPHDDATALALYGADKLITILNHFALPLKQIPHYSKVEAKKEWRDLKVFVSKHHSQTTFLPLWKHIISLLKDRFPNICLIAELVLVFPLSTACCERVFSYMKRVKSDWRSRMDTVTLDSILMIRLNGETPLVFDPSAAVQYWWSCSQRCRRPEYKEHSATK